MASVHRRPGSKFWHAFFRDSDGRLNERSTKLVDRKKAQRVADEMEVVAQRGNSRTFQRGLRRGSPCHNISQVCIWLVGDQKARSGSRQLSGLRKSDCAISRVPGPKPDNDISEVSRKSVVEFRNKLAANGFSSDTVGKYISASSGTALTSGVTLSVPSEISAPPQFLTRGQRIDFFKFAPQDHFALCPIPIETPVGHQR